MIMYIPGQDAIITPKPAYHCRNCKSKIEKGKEIKAKIKYNGYYDTFHFCNNQCKNNFEMSID